MPTKISIIKIELANDCTIQDANELFTDIMDEHKHLIKNCEVEL